MNETDDPLQDVDVQNATLESVDREAVRAGLRHDEQSVVWRAQAVCEVLAAEGVTDIDPFLEDLIPLLTADNAATSQRAGGLLWARAKEDADPFTDHVEEVLALWDVDTGGHRTLAASILAEVAIEDVGAIRPHVDAVVDALADVDVAVETEFPEQATIDNTEMGPIWHKDQEETQIRADARNKMVNVLVAVVEDDPAAVSDVVPDVAGLLDHDDAVVVANAIDALTEFAKHDPSLVEPHVEDLIEQLDHYDEVVRARAIRALGYAEATEAVDALRSVAEDDDEDDVREMAAETATFLEAA